MKIACVDEMRFMDRYCLEKLGIAEEILMENAAFASLRLLQREVGIRNKKFIIFCGGGNNGGDGLALARLIHACGGKAKVFLLMSPKKYSGAARTNYNVLCNLPIDVQLLKKADEARIDVAHSDAVIDAIFGTGLDREVKGLAADIIALINTCRKPVFSLDIPSGINGNSGDVMGVAVRAGHTVTFGLPKIGNLLYPGYGYCGDLSVAHISFPPELYDRGELKIQTNRFIEIPPRPFDAYKGSMGDVLFIAGAANYFGAPYFCAMGFLKAGGGYSRLAAPASAVPFIAQEGREIVYLPQEETAQGSIALKNKAALLEAAAKVDAVVIGPGLSLHEETQQLVRELAAAVKVPLLIDGDGITAIAGTMDIIKKRKVPTILTPHLGEMSRLTQKSSATINADRIAVLQETAGKLGATIVLKGAHSLIGYADGRIFVNLTGNAGMATAGSGDVLNGCIAAMLGMGLTPELAARKGVFLHGYAGDLAAIEKGADGMTARDILEALPLALKHDREGVIDAKYYEPPEIL
jgi:ADP-dependent NAD(P)H-hydrate dehydratase / NAD(P)H-hydrate epimerase